MTETRITDTVEIRDAQTTSQGYLEANAFTARTGVQQYAGFELDRPDLGIVNVYRDEAEVFAKKSLKTFAGIPVTLDHPPVLVDADNWEKHAKGHTKDDVLRDGEHLKIGLKITDRAAVDAVQGGKRGLSVGYTSHIEWGDGVAPDGTPYQARQTGIVANHIAIVDRGRAGSKARIGDDAKNRAGDGAGSWGASPITDAGEKEGNMSDLRTILVDGLQVQTTEAGAQAIDKLTDQVAAKDKAITDAEAAHKAAIAAKDTELAKKDTEIDELKGKILSDEEIDKRVKARADLIDRAKKVDPKVVTDGLSDDAICEAVVKAKIGDEAVKDRSDDYIRARFDGLVEAAGKSNKDSFADGLKGSPKTSDDPLGDAYEARDKRIADAWKTEKETS